jgi:phage tail sheath gpL-like
MANLISEPSVSVPIVPAAPVASVAPKLTTIIGQSLAAGTATNGVLLEDINVYAADTLFGAGSVLATMVNNFAKINTVSQVDVIALEDSGTAVQSEGIFTITGTATASGTIDFYVGSKDRKYSIDIVATDTETDVGDALEAAITADTKALVTAANVAGIVTLTAKNGGTIGDTIGLMYEGSAAGISVAITAMTGGANDPSMTGIADLLVKRTDIVMPYEYDISTFQTLLQSRFNVDNDILDGRLFTAVSDTKTALVVIGDAENDQSLVIFPDKPVNTTTKKGTAIFEMLYNMSSQFAAVRSLRLESDPAYAITDWVTTTQPRDQKSGPHTNSLPYHNTLLLLPVIPTGQGWTTSEVADLKDAGFAIIGNNKANNAVICGSILTTYKTNIAGQDDDSYKYLNYVDTATAAREYIFNSLKIDYAQSRLTNGTAVPGYDYKDANAVAADMKRYHETLSGVGYALLQEGTLPDGRIVIDVFEDNLTVEVNVRTGNIDIYAPLFIVTQVRSIFAPLQITFNPQDL